MKSKLMTMLMAFTLLFSVMLTPFTNANAANSSSENETESVTVHKLLMNADQLNTWKKWNEDVKEKNKGVPEGYDGSNLIDLEQLNRFNEWNGENAVKEIDGIFFAWQRKIGEEWVYIDNKGNKTDIQKPEDPQFKNKVMGKLTTESGAEFNTESLPNDTYQIVEIKTLSTYVGSKGELSTGGLAVPVVINLPLINENGAINNAHVYPKNTSVAPRIDKNFQKEEEGDLANAGAKYENYQEPKDIIGRNIGDFVPYEVKTEIPAGSDFKTVRWEDTMSYGLTYNSDLRITLNGEPLKSEYYLLIQNQSGFILELNDAGLKYLKDITKDDKTEFSLTYSATVNSSAIIDIPDENNIIFYYGNKPKEFKNPRDNEVKPNERKITVNKTWADGEAPVGANVKYYLYEMGASAGDDKVITWVEKTGFPYDHTFEKLDNTKNYYVKEAIVGYDPSYKVTENGSVSIINTKDPTNPPPLDPTEPKVVTYGKKFVKTDGTKDGRLAGAEFVIRHPDPDYRGFYLQANDPDKKDAYDTAQKAYIEAVKAYNSTENPTTEQVKAVEDARIARDNAWYDYVNNLNTRGPRESALILTSNEYGQFEIKGLGRPLPPIIRGALPESIGIQKVYASEEINPAQSKSSYKYILEEITPPAGYTIPNNSKEGVEFEVGPNSYMNGNIAYEIGAPASTNDALEVKNMKITIPQTGGIGSLIFIVAGIAIMALALVMRRRSQYDRQ